MNLLFPDKIPKNIPYYCNKIYTMILEKNQSTRNYEALFQKVPFFYTSYLFFNSAITISASAAERYGLFIVDAK